MIYSQNSNANVVFITSQDSVKLICNEKDYFLKFYFLNNINFNKSQKKQKLVDGSVYCGTCKKEEYSVSVKPINERLLKINKQSVQDFLYKKNGYTHYFYFKGKFYKYLGRITE